MFRLQLNSIGRLTTSLFCGLLCLSANSVFADMVPFAISGVSGKAFQQGDNADFGDGSISRSLNGNGLTVGNPSDPSTWNHNTDWQANWQGNGSFTGGSTPGAWYVADLQQSYSNLGRLWIWNVRETGVTDRGTKDINLYYATSPSVTPVTGGAYNFGGGGWTLWGNYTIPQAPGGATAADMSIVLAGIPAAQYIGFDIVSNYGSTFRVGFAELQFTTPEPGSAALLATGALAIGLVRRRRQS